MRRPRRNNFVRWSSLQGFSSRTVKRIFRHSHFRNVTIFKRRASATSAFFIPRRLAICTAQALSHDHFVERNMLWAAS
jgi:hypothetical protein